MYIEHYFEQKGVRFLSVAENIDSANGLDNLVLPFTNVINSFYARQSSSKTKAAFQARARAGMFIGSRAPFGYIKDPNDNHHLIVDPPAADVVRDIFRMFADGVGYVRMAKILRERGVLNPQAYFNQNNPDYFKSDYWRQPHDWHPTSIRVILNNPVYLGKTVFGRTKTKGFFDKSRVHTDEEDWIVVDDTHEALITQELWDTVHQMMAARRRENGKGEVQPFIGLVKCAGCGSALNVSYDKRKGKYTSFSCWVYKNYGKQRCTSHAISYNALSQLVLEDIRRNAVVAKKYTAKYMEMLVAAKEEKKKADTDRLKRELKAADKRIDELAREVESSEEVYENIEKFLPVIWKYTDIEKLDARILNELIDRIVVHEKELGPDGLKHQRVDIHYKFIGYVDIEEEWNKDENAQLLREVFEDMTATV